MRLSADATIRCPLVVAPPPLPPVPSNVSAILQFLLNEDMLGNSSNSSTGGSSSSSSSSDSGELFPYASSSILFCIIAFLCTVYFILIVWKYHGYYVQRVREAPSPSSYTSSSVNHSSAPRSNGSDYDELKIRTIRMLTPATNNLSWLLYFGSNIIHHTIAVVLLQVHALSKYHEGQLILEFGKRLFLGTNCAMLVVALNHQRLYRVKDHRRAKVSPELQRQVRIMNYSCFGSFLIFIAADFVMSHVVDSDSNAEKALYWVYIAFLCIIALPLIAATLWVVLNQSAVQPTRAAKAMLTLGVIVHLVAMLPPSLWNQYIVSNYVETDPCPFADGNMPFADLMVCLNVGSITLFFVFAVVEHRRARLSDHVIDYQNQCDALEKWSSLSADGRSGPNSLGGRDGPLLQEDEEFDANAIREVDVPYQQQ